MGREELRRRALLLKPDRAKELDCWQEPAWEHFRLRLFNVSELMRNVQGEFATWFNQRFKRRGHFWGERFSSTLLADGDAVMDAMIYVELNAVRAHLVDSPEFWEHGSFYLRDMGLDSWLMPLAEALPGMDPETVERDYRARLFYRGAVRSKKGDHVIPQHIIDDEVRRGFKSRGAYLKRLRHFTRGLVLGSREAVAGWIAELGKQGRCSERRRPAALPSGSSFQLRPQRTRGSPA